MIETLLGVGLAALLFALFGALRYRGCTGHCAGCTGTCGRYSEEEHHEA